MPAFILAKVPKQQTQQQMRIADFMMKMAGPDDERSTPAAAKFAPRQVIGMAENYHPAWISSSAFSARRAKIIPHCSLNTTGRINSATLASGTVPSPAGPASPHRAKRVLCRRCWRRGSCRPAPASAVRALRLRSPCATASGGWNTCRGELALGGAASPGMSRARSCAPRRVTPEPLPALLYRRHGRSSASVSFGARPPLARVGM